MSYVIATPEMMTSAAADLATIGLNVNAAHMVAAARTTSVISAAADEVSTGIARLFSQHAQGYQALAGQAAAFNDQFVQHLTAGAGSYASAEAAIASFLQDLQNLPNVIADALAAPFPGEATIASFFGNVNNLIMSVPGLNDNLVLVAALLELPFLIAFLILGFPIWLPLLIVLSPYLLLGLLLAA